MTDTTSAEQPSSAALCLEDFALPEQLSERYPQFPEPRLRWWLRERERNGLAPHVRKLGKQLYVHVPGFAHWVDSHAA